MKKIWFAALAAVATCVGSFDMARGQSFEDLVIGSSASKTSSGSSFSGSAFQRMVLDGESAALSGAKGTGKARALKVVERAGTYGGIGVTQVDDASTELVNVGMDRADLRYCLGDSVKISVTSSTDGYLYLFSVDCEGNKTLLLPNKLCSDNKIVAKQTQVYPTREMNFDLEIVYGTGAFGTEKVVAFVTKEPLRTAKNVELEAIATSVTDAQAQKIFDEMNVLIEKNVEAAKGGIGLKSRKRDNVTVGECVYTTVGTRRSGGASQPDEQQPAPVRKQAKRFVLCVGLNEYLQATPLTLCEADAIAFATAARDYMGVDQGNFCVLKSKDATLANVRKAICEVLPKLTQPGDEIFIYWSGHGGQMGTAMQDKNDSYLVTYDGDFDNPVDTMLTEDDFGKWIQNSLKGRNVMVFIDACHSGGLLENGGAKAFASDTFARSKSLGGSGVFVLASSSRNQLSWETRGAETLSVMTHYLVETIKKGKSTLTHDDLKPAIQDDVAEYVEKKYNVEQTVVDYRGLRPAVRLLRD